MTKNEQLCQIYKKAYDLLVKTEKTAESYYEYEFTNEDTGKINVQAFPHWLKDLSMELNEITINLSRLNHGSFVKDREKIIAFLKIPLPENWYSLTRSQHIEYWDFVRIGLRDPGPAQRDRVCAKEIWLELFRGKYNEYDQCISRKITAVLRTLPDWQEISSYYFGKAYGRTRGFIRKL